MAIEKQYTVLGKEKSWEYTEDALQTRCIGWFRIQYRKKLAFHVPNEGKRKVQYRKKLKDMGLLAGVSDILIMNRSRGYSGLVVELKRKGGRVQDSQIDFLNAMAAENFKCVVVYNFDAFQDLVNWYFEQKSNYVEVPPTQK